MNTYRQIKVYQKSEQVHDFVKNNPEYEIESVFVTQNGKLVVVFNVCVRDK